MILKSAQISALQAGSQQSYVDTMLRHFRAVEPPFLPHSDLEARAYLQEKVREARSFRFRKPQNCERWLYLCLSYPQLNDRRYAEEIVENLTWPDRSEEDRLEILYQLLTA